MKQWIDFETEISENPHLLGGLFGMNDLSDIHSEWINYLFQTKQYTALQAHRDSYKTTCLVIGIIRELLYNPNKTILLLRKTDTLAKDILETVKKHLTSEAGLALFHEYYDFDKLEGETWNKDKIDLSIRNHFTPEANLTAIGIGASVTGKHPDIIVIDDIITQDDRYSKAERENVKRYVMEMLNVVRDGGKIIFTGTPWHEDDAWKTIEKITKEIRRYSIHDINPPILSKEKLSIVKEGMTPSLFAANYELKHINDGMRIFGEPIFDEWDFAINTIGHIDPAYSGDNFTSFTIAGLRPDRTIQVKGWAWRKDITQCYNEIVELCKTHRVGNLYVESNADKGFSVRDLKRLRGGFVVPYFEKENKHIRIIQTIRPNWSRVKFAYDCQKEYLSQVVDYQEGEEPDDSPDSLAGVLRLLDNRFQFKKIGADGAL